MNYGDPIHGEIIDANAQGGTYPLVLYLAATATARALLPTEFLTITDILFISTAGGVYDFVMDTAAAGRHIIKGNAAALGGLIHSFDTPITCPVGVTPNLIVAAGQVDLIITGYVTKV